MTVIQQSHFGSVTIRGCENVSVPPPGRLEQSSKPRKIPTLIKFSQPWTPDSTVRQKELELSAQRSHTARVVRARRKKEEQRRSNIIDSEGCTFGSTATSKASNEHTLEANSVIRFPLANINTELTALFKGNSDPFDSYAFPVNPHVNRMISFARESYYPSLSVAPSLRKHAKPEDYLRFFELGRVSADSTVAHLTCYGAALVRILPEGSRKHLEKAWLQVRNQALQTLRRSLPQDSGTGSLAVPLIQQCLYLFQADVEARLFHTAKIHATTLRYLFGPLPSSPTTIFLFLTAMHSTLETACFPLEPPIMTFDEWHPDMWHSVWANAEDMIATISPQYSTADLHPGIASPFLRDVLVRFRLYLTSPTLNPVNCTPEQQAQFDLISLWTATRFVDDALKLLTHFLELADSSDRPSSGSPDDQAVTTTGVSTALLWEAMLTLTTFCIIRNYVHCPYLDDTGIDLRDASYILAPKFRETLESLLNGISAKDEKRNGEILLWIYFTGALFEKRTTLYRHQLLEKMAEDEDEKTAWWFCRKLADQARQLNSMGWADAAKILTRFAYGDALLKPEPQEWWDSIFEL